MEWKLTRENVKIDMATICDNWDDPGGHFVN
jgi:hypothetical protein